MYANEFDKMFSGHSQGLPTHLFPGPSPGLPMHLFPGPSPGLPTHLFPGPSPGLPTHLFPGPSPGLPTADLSSSLSHVSHVQPLGQAMAGNKNDGKLAKEYDQFYHYTNKEGADAIEKSRKIKASRKEKGDAVFGDGTYFTSMDPGKHSKKDIRRNNYDTNSSFYNQSRFKDKADYAIRVSLPKSAAKDVNADGRDIYLFEGDVDLDDYDYDVIKKKD